MKKACPHCGKPENKEYRPFCSKRCADVDLGHWLKESYVVKGAEPASEEDIVEAISSGNIRDNG